MKEIWKRAASAALFISALILLVEYSWKDATLTAISTELNNWAVVIGAFALGLGAYSLVMRHGRIIYRRESMWPYSTILLVTMITFIVVGLTTGSVTSFHYNWIYTAIIQPVSSTLYGMNAFFIASACYRAFKARSLEALLLLLAAIFLMFLNAPIGGVIHPVLPMIGKVIWDFSGATGMRAILIGIGIGTLALGLRIIIGEEKTPLGGAD
ncbi:MAG: hypothetical protein QW638_01425 [Candidatus Bathyarchaeia archaeon]|nr:hypothetical protein [Candidatus Bathyarchaeota archaeon]